MFPARFWVVAFLLCCSPLAAQTQPTYSIDWQSPTNGLLDSAFLTPITEGDILTLPFVPGLPPLIFISGGFGPPPGLGLPLHPPAMGHPGGVPGFVEVDALSYGFDLLVEPGPNPFIPQQWLFSVDEFAQGLQPPVPLPPNVSTEGAAFFPAPAPYEASADVFGYFPPGAIPPGLGPMPPFSVPPGNTDILDGDGLGPIGPVSLGLIEPNFPVPGPFDSGDNLDALDIDTNPDGLFPVYYSLDSAFVFDFIDGFPNTGSAMANGGFSGADVLVTFVPGGPPAVYAPGFMLGLDIIQGFDSDDLDALVLRENGDGVFTPSQGPYDWVFDPNIDMLFFSVRRGSAIIGVPDHYFGIPIEEGDILVPAGPVGTPPGIWMAAENLGLCTFLRGGPCPTPAWGPHGDDLDALDIAHDCDDDGIPDPLAILQGLAADCNNNGFPDNCDIAYGLSMDVNGNGIPDECEAPKFIRGDADASGVFNALADALYVLTWGFLGGPPPPCDDAADADDTGVLNALADALYILQHGFLGGPPPPAPYPLCGPDPSADPLGCATHPCP